MPLTHQRAIEPGVMADKFRDECGVFGIFDHEHAARLTYLGLYALQHRGQESAGMVASDGLTLTARRGMGYVSDVFDEETLDQLKGRLAIGHVRYSTAGEVSLREAQPFLVAYHGGQVALCHNGNMPRALKVRQRLEREGAIFQSTSDTEVALHLIARSGADNLVDALVEALTELDGAFSMLVATPQSLIAVRDPRGFRPLSLGQLDGSYVFASESCAFDLIGARLLRDIEPGELIVVDGDGSLQSHFPFQRQRPAQCIFEHVYFSRPDSVVYGRPVSQSRYQLGRWLAREHPADADVVVPVPDSGVAAIGYAMESGIEFCFGLIRNHYVGRTFIEPKASIRHLRVKVKLNPVRDLLDGRRVVLVDDSIVRGTTCQEIVQMVRAAGAREVHLRISCPPTISPCYYGIDTPRKRELIAAEHAVEEIRQFIGADSLGYLSYQSLLKACGDVGNTKYCTSCFTGAYPTEIDADYEPRLVEAPSSLRG